MGRIVVGVDGSAGAARAAEWAAGQARRSGDVVELVHVIHPGDWDTPVFAASERAVPGWVAAEIRLDVIAEELHLAHQHEMSRAGAVAAASRRLDDILAPLRGELRGLTVERVTVADRHPAEVLVERARDADLLVVGRRGRGALDGFGLGSVSAACAANATCPVVIVRDPD